MIGGWAGGRGRWDVSMDVGDGQELSPDDWGHVQTSEVGRRRGAIEAKESPPGAISY